MPHFKGRSQDSGVIHLLPLVVIAAVLALGAYLFVAKSNIANFLPDSVRPFTQNKTSVAPQAKYQNPLDAKSQYTNPFNDYKNPFDSLK